MMMIIAFLPAACSLIKPGLDFHDDLGGGVFLADSLLLLDVQNLFEKRALVENLNTASVDGNKDSTVVDKLSRQFHAILIGKRQALLSCASRHIEERLAIAYDCAHFAEKISSTEESAGSLRRVRGRMGQRVNGFLKDLESSALSVDVQEKLYEGILFDLERILSMAPEDKEIMNMLSKVRATQAKAVSELVAEGDKLYREQRVKQAMQVWQRALVLDAGNKKILDRIERAKRVLGGVEKLKRSSS
ncbi:MAG: hypothetical protein OEZ23_05205 [Gammaproteobacteria bacterium]|nr:hypothetical protein [Gammaproteobacteria bacterium]